MHKVERERMAAEERAYEAWAAEHAETLDREAYEAWAAMRDEDGEPSSMTDYEEHLDSLIPDYA